MMLPWYVSSLLPDISFSRKNEKDITSVIEQTIKGEKCLLRLKEIRFHFSFLLQLYSSMLAGFNFVLFSTFLQLLKFNVFMHCMTYFTEFGIKCRINERKPT